MSTMRTADDFPRTAALKSWKMILSAAVFALLPFLLMFLDSVVAEDD